MVVTSGPLYGTPNDQTGMLTADDDALYNVDSGNYKTELVSDAQGRLTLPVLIPGATYRVVDESMVVRDRTGPQLRKEFIVKPGETIDLGKIVIEKPE